MKIWTDGGCNPNPGIGGWGWVRSDGVEDCGGKRDTTNNRMEMTAIIEALSKLPDGQKVVVYSDSQYCIKGLTIWHRGWKAKNWMKKGEPMINRDLWLELDQHSSRLDVKFLWVKGHNGDQMNERADELATIGSKKPIREDAAPLTTDQYDDLSMLVLAYRDLHSSFLELSENFKRFDSMLKRVSENIAMDKSK